jgi:hypothetical protein
VRTYGRPVNRDGTRGPWTEVTTDPNGFDDMVWLTTLAQVLQLNLNESPFFANWGIPGYPAVVQQVFPDYYIAQTQQRFAGRFASLIVAKINTTEPTYQINIVTHQGVRLNVSIPVPQ